MTTRKQPTSSPVALRYCSNRRKSVQHKICILKKRKKKKRGGGGNTQRMSASCRGGIAQALLRPTPPECAQRSHSRVGISIRAWQRTRRNFVRLIPRHTHIPSASRGEKNRTRTGGHRVAVLVHERVALLQQVVLQCIQVPERLFVQALALVR